MGGKGSGRPKSSDCLNGTFADKVYKGFYLPPEVVEKIRLGAFASGNIKHSHYIELLVKQDKDLTLQIFANELIMLRNELDLSIEKVSIELENQKALRNRVSALLRRLGRQ